MNYGQLLKYIYSRELFGMKLGLENIKDLAKKLDNPQLKYKTIHVAGTNGKGSTCSVIASILQKQGYKVGLFTSPHLVDFKERIKVNGKKITKKEVITLLKKIKPLIKKHTYFEVVTALAFSYFAKKKVDFAVVEVGLGGRLDATNIISPEVSVITNISLEHTKHLGNTIEKIAYEKAGIIKKDIPVIVSKDCKGISVIKKIAKKNNSKIYIAPVKKVKSSLKSSFQEKNISTALKTIEVLKKKDVKISSKAIKQGLLSARWPGRFEFIEDNILFDCAHNPAGAKALAKELKKLKYKNIYIIFGVMADKDIEHMCKPLEPIAKEIILTKPSIKRAAEPKKIAHFFHKNLFVINNIQDALEYAKLNSTKDDLIVLTGSIFTIGEAFSFIRPEPFNT